MRKILFILIAGFCLSACTELDNIEFLNLKRDNPLDGKNSTNMIDGVNLTYSNYTIVDDNNDDGIINKGETVTLKVYLTNTGTSTANGVKATFSSTNSYLSAFSPTTQVSYGDISSGATTYGQTSYGSSGYYTIKFTVSSSTPVNTQIPISINIVDESVNTWTSSFNVTVQ